MTEIPDDFPNQTSIFDVQFGDFPAMIAIAHLLQRRGPLYVDCVDACGKEGIEVAQQLPYEILMDKDNPGYIIWIIIAYNGNIMGIPWEYDGIF